MAFDENGSMRELCIQQGYVPEGCQMDGFMIMAFINSAKDPCDGCKEDKLKCGGRPTRAEVNDV